LGSFAFINFSRSKFESNSPKKKVCFILHIHHTFSINSMHVLLEMNKTNFSKFCENNTTTKKKDIEAQSRLYEKIIYDIYIYIFFATIV
jgi:hypothetical protein